MNTTYITTPIYYVNDVPHIGHAYTTVIADTVARFARLKGDDTYFMTGTDEHGQKIEEAAAKHGQSPKQYADGVSAKFKDLWDEFDISYDMFSRTTDAAHEADFLAKRRGEEERTEKFDEESQAQNEVEEWHDAAELRR